MKTDLKTLPFSRRGSYLVISELNENWNGCGNEPGLYLRTVHSSAQLPLVARIDLREGGKPIEYGQAFYGYGPKIRFCREFRRDHGRRSQGPILYLDRKRLSRYVSRIPLTGFAGSYGS